MLTPAFAGELFGAGQPLDASKYYIIIPDAIGHGKSSKPSDGLRAKFPKYNYDDMVEAQYRLVKDGLGIRHVRLVIGNLGRCTSPGEPSSLCRKRRRCSAGTPTPAHWEVSRTYLTPDRSRLSTQ